MERYEVAALKQVNARLRFVCSNWKVVKRILAEVRKEVPKAEYRIDRRILSDQTIWIQFDLGVAAIHLVSSLTTYLCQHGWQLLSVDGDEYHFFRAVEEMP